MAAPQGQFPLSRMHVQLYMADVSTANIVYYRVPVDGRLTKIETTLQAAITAADAAITVEKNGTLVAGSEITVAQSGSAPGDLDEATPTALGGEPLVKGDLLEIISDGASSTAAALVINLTIEQA